MKQILVIHGGTTFTSYESYMNALIEKEVTLERLLGNDWKVTLQERLGNDFLVILPRMPNSNFAHYKEWEIYFKKILEVLDDTVILVGHSLGGIFLAKFFSENKINKKVSKLILIAPPLTSTPDEDLADFEFDLSLLSNVEHQVDFLTLIHSKDDPVVPYEHSVLYKKHLPHAELVTLDERGHCTMSEFPELVTILKG